MLTFWYTLASSWITWFLAWSFLALPPGPYHSYHPHSRYTQSVLVFLCDRSTLCSICQCFCDHCFVHLVLHIDGYLLSHSTTVSYFHVINASLVSSGCRCHSLVLHLSRCWTPKYLNVVTVFSFSSRISS